MKASSFPRVASCINLSEIFKKRLPAIQYIYDGIGIKQDFHCRDKRSLPASSTRTGLWAVIPTRLSKIACLFRAGSDSLSLIRGKHAVMRYSILILFSLSL
jgi:hypothetical protein